MNHLIKHKIYLLSQYFYHSAHLLHLSRSKIEAQWILSYLIHVKMLSMLQIWDGRSPYMIYKFQNLQNDINNAYLTPLPWKLMAVSKTNETISSWPGNLDFENAKRLRSVASKELGHNCFRISFVRKIVFDPIPVSFVFSWNQFRPDGSETNYELQL